MIAGYSGRLLPELVLERVLVTPDRERATAAWHRDVQTWRTACAALGPASGLRAMVDVGALPLLSALGWQPPVAFTGRDDCMVGIGRSGQACAVLLVTPWGANLDGFWRTAVVAGLQAGAAWCVLFNGTHLRLLDATRLHSRRFIELDLDSAADDARCAAALLAVFGRDGLGASAHRASVRAMLAVASEHATGVCRSLRLGVIDASTQVLGALLGRRHDLDRLDVFDQSLTIVFRLLFLLFAEARGLVPLWHPTYRESYSVDALRRASLDPSTVGVWDTLRAMTRLAHAGCRAGGLNVTAFNGRLFSPARTPLAERHGLDDAAAKRAVVAVSTRPADDGEGRERIDYRDLGVEQLGAVYETLLDYEPQIEQGARGAPLRVSLRSGSGLRKATGTFYTPESLVTYLVRDTLGPLVRDASPEQILQLSVLDPSMGSGAFLVAACRFLADAYETALVATGRCLASDIGPADRSAIRRIVAERCLFGVDINPTAVQLARLSLWLTTLAADRPLTFFDHHLRVGDSLAGTWLARLRSSPVRVRAAEPLPLFPEGAMEDAVRSALPIRFRLATDPNDTAAQIHAKERALDALSTPGAPLATWTRVADLWCGAWFASPPIPPQSFGPLRDSLVHGHASLTDAMSTEFFARADALRARHRLFHWELEFPEVFFGPDGSRRADAGFDAVLGNPPWDMVRADGRGDRTAARRDSAALVRFVRDSGVYEARSEGHVNRYQLFVDRSIALCRPGGRIGLVLPSGIVSDASSAGVRRLLFSRCSVEHLVGFDNRSGTFPIHRSVKFVLLTAAAGAATTEIACRFGETDPLALDRAFTDTGQFDPGWFTTRVSSELLHHISGDDRAVPDLRAPVDLAILERASRLFAPLGSRTGWHAQFGRELNITDDKPYLRENPMHASAARRSEACLPVLEGKHIAPFRVEASRTRWLIAPSDADRLLGTRHHRARLAYRDVASPTNRVTLIAAVLPAQSVSTHTLFCLKTPLGESEQWMLCALLNSLVVNYLTRMRVSTHVTTAIVERLPIPREDQIGPVGRTLAAAGERLARGEDRDTFSALNAQVAHLYQLREAEFAHVLETFPLIDRSERDDILQRYRAL